MVINYTKTRLYFERTNQLKYDIVKWLMFIAALNPKANINIERFAKIFWSEILQNMHNNYGSIASFHGAVTSESYFTNGSMLRGCRGPKFIVSEFHFRGGNELTNHVINYIGKLTRGFKETEPDRYFHPSKANLKGFKEQFQKCEEALCFKCDLRAEVSTNVFIVINVEGIKAIREFLKQNYPSHYALSTVEKLKTYVYLELNKLGKFMADSKWSLNTYGDRLAIPTITFSTIKADTKTVFIKRQYISSTTHNTANPVVESLLDSMFVDERIDIGAESNIIYR